MVPTCAISSFLETGREIFAQLPDGGLDRFLDAAADRRRAGARGDPLQPLPVDRAARRVAVVVPSPAMSDVFDATTLTSLAPMFSNGSGSSISFETVTPSLVTVGPPNDCSGSRCGRSGRAWCRRRGPGYRRPRTSSAVRRRKKAVALPRDNLSSVSGGRAGCRGCGRDGRSRFACPAPPPVSLDNFREDIGLAKDLDLLAVHFDLHPRILAEEDLVPLSHADRGALARVEELAWADGEHLAPLWLLLGRVGQDDPAGRLLLGFNLLDHDAVFERANLWAMRNVPFAVSADGPAAVRLLVLQG